MNNTIQTFAGAASSAAENLLRNLCTADTARVEEALAAGWSISIAFSGSAARGFEVRLDLERAGESVRVATVPLKSVVLQ